MEIRNSMRGLTAGQFAPGDLNVDDARKNVNDIPIIDPNVYNDQYFMDRLKHSTHSTRSDYATSIRNWLHHVPKEQLLLLQYTQISTDPRMLLTKVCTFLDVDADLLLDHNNLSDADLTKKVNAASTSSTTTPSILATPTTTASRGGDDTKLPIVTTTSQDSTYIRPLLRKKMERHLRPMQADFNSLLKELGYDWQL
jgi:hypothetical protein